MNTQESALKIFLFVTEDSVKRKTKGHIKEKNIWGISSTTDWLNNHCEQYLNPNILIHLPPICKRQVCLTWGHTSAVHIVQHNYMPKLPQGT